MMEIRNIALHPFQLTHQGKSRPGFYIQIVDKEGNEGWGECTPLPSYSQESLQECLAQFISIQKHLIKQQWETSSLFQVLETLDLFPSLLFGIESSLLSLLSPVNEHTVKASALFMGNPEEIFQQAKMCKEEGYTSAKIKVGNLNFDEAAVVLHRLKNQFKLRVDVNRSWSTSASFRFFSQFDSETFDYVEEPFQNPQDLFKFPHPIAIDESYPRDLTLKDLEKLPNLKALIYKPTLQGGILNCLPLKEWSIKNQISLVLSSSFESPIGLSHVSSMAHRLSLTAPVGIGTAYF